MPSEAAREPPLRVTVAYALPERQWLLAVELPAGSTVADAIEQSGIRHQLPELTIEPRQVGVFDKLCALATPLRDGDRVELYRSLQCDPKAVRRQRAERAADKPD